MKSLIKQGFLNGINAVFEQNLREIDQQQQEKIAAASSHAAAPAGGGFGWGSAALGGLAGLGLGAGGMALYNHMNKPKETPATEDYMADQDQAKAFTQQEPMYADQYYGGGYGMQDQDYGLDPQQMQMLNQLYGMYG